MKCKPIVINDAASDDIEFAINWYFAEAGRSVARAFVEDLRAAYERIAEYPASGSPRYAHELGLPGLRSSTLRHYPFLVFYKEESDVISVWRVLHAHRDLPTRMQMLNH